MELHQCGTVELTRQTRELCKGDRPSAQGIWQIEEGLTDLKGDGTPGDLTTCNSHRQPPEAVKARRCTGRDEHPEDLPNASVTPSSRGDEADALSVGAPPLGCRVHGNGGPG